MQTNQAVPEVLALIRFSTTGQVSEGKAGIEGQRSVNESSARFHGVKIRREVVVVNVSGADVMDDPQFQQIFKELPDPTLAGILLPEQSRLVRPETFDDWAVLAHFQRNHKLIYTPTGCIDPNTPEGRQTLTFGGMMSGEELHTLKTRFARGKRSDRLEGKCPAGTHTLPRTVTYVRERNEFGKTVRGHWELVPLEVERMKRAFQLLFEGDSYELIAEKIGGGWTGKGIHYAMMNPIHIGIRRYQWEAKGEKYPPKPTAKNPNPKKRRPTVKREQPLDVPTREALESGKAQPIVEPILSLAEWDQAQEIIASRMTGWSKSKLKNEGRDRFVAIGLARCSCGEKLYGKYGSRPHRDEKTRQLVSSTDAYICKTRHPAGRGCGMQSIKRIDLDSAIAETIGMLVNVDFLLTTLKAALALQEAAPNPARVERELALAKLESGRKELLAMVRSGDMTRNEFRQQMTALEQEVRALEALVPAPAPQADPRRIAERVVAVFTQFVILSFIEQRSLLRGAVKEIIVDSHARAITSVTISGGYLGRGANSANSVLPSTTQYGISAIPDLTIRFPHPVAIPDTYVDRRRTNGNHPASREALAIEWEAIQ